jgi:hypothetical protein
MSQTKLVNIRQLSAETGVPVRTLRSLYHARKISAIRAGYRTVLFRVETTLAELDRFTVKAITT